MPQDRLSFTMRATVGRGTAPPNRYGDGPLPHGFVRIPVEVQVVLPPEATAPDGSGTGVAVPVTVRPAAPPGRTGQPARTTGRWRALPRGEAGQRVLDSLFAGTADPRMPGNGTGGGIPGGGMRPGELAAKRPDATRPGIAGLPAVAPWGRGAGTGSGGGVSGEPTGTATATRSAVAPKQDPAGAVSDARILEGAADRIGRQAERPGPVASASAAESKAQHLRDAAAYLDQHAHEMSTAQCAHYVSNALRAEGLDWHNVGDAKDFGPQLLAKGFQSVSRDGYQPQTGDVAVIQNYPGGNEAGHTAMWDGTQWVSDYKQKNAPEEVRKYGFSTPYPGSRYRAAAPDFAIYRR